MEETNDNILSSDEEHEHGHHHEEEIVYDEHIWLSIKNAISMTEAIRDKLIIVYPEKQELFRINANAYIEKLRVLDNEYSSSISNKTDTIIIADRFPFRYLVNDYKINYYAIFSGCSSETEASAETMATLINKINENDVNYLLVLETSDQSIAISCQNNNNCKDGLEILVINSCQGLSQSTIQSSSYFDIMSKNLEVLQKAINK